MSHAGITTDRSDELPASKASLDAAAPTRAPESSPTDLAISLLIFAASVAYFSLLFRHVRFHFDEGMALQGAQRILHGQVLYRDFFSFYTPGSYYWLALLFKVFGSSIVVGRAALMVYGGVLSVLTYLLARRVCSPWNALFAVLPTAFVALPGWFLIIHSWDSTLWALLALYCAVRFLERRVWTWAFAMSSLVAATCLVEQSKGGGLVLGLCAGFLVLLAGEGLSGWGGKRAIVAVLVGFAIPIVATLVYFGAHGALRPMVVDLMWPFHHYAGPSRAFYGDVEIPFAELLRDSLGWRAFAVLVMSPLFIVSSLPIFAAGALLYWSFTFGKARKRTRSSAYYVLISAALSGLLLSTLATGRPDATHIMLQAPLFCVVLGWMAEAARSPFLKAVKTVGVSYTLVALGALAVPALIVPLAANYKVETRGGTVRTMPDAAEALAYIQNQVTPGEKILVYPYQPLYYYLTGTFSVSRYERLLTGTYTASQFEEMAQELRASQPRVVLFDPTFSDFVLRICPNVPIQALAADDPVADYLFSRYRPCRSFGEPITPWHAVFMVRNDLSCPGNGPELAQKR